MGNIIAFLTRFYHYFLFIILELVSIFLIVNNNHYQNSVFLNLTYELSGKVYSVYDKVSDYFYLEFQNDSLLAENARLHNLLNTSYYFDTAKTHRIDDTLIKQKYSFIPCRVVNNSITGTDNFMTIIGGSRDSITKSMGVITTSGVVGITKNVSPNYSSVLSVLHSEFKLSAEIKELGEIGTVVWKGKNPTIIQLNDITIHAKVRKGMHVVTSPYSMIFPEGTTIGTIVSYEIKSGDSFFTIMVKLASNLSNVKKVYVIKNLMTEEQTGVEKIK